MSDLILCDRCNEMRGKFRFEQGSNICRDCKRLPPPPTVSATDLSPYNRKRYKDNITSLNKLPAYRQYREEHSLRCAQFGSAFVRGVGHVDR
jgi:hypothetical protein